MSVIEEALRTAEAEAEKQKLESEGFPSLSGMIRLPAESGPRSTGLLAAAFAAALLLLGLGGWLAYRSLADGSGRSAERLAELEEPVPARSAAGREATAGEGADVGGGDRGRGEAVAAADSASREPLGQYAGMAASPWEDRTLRPEPTGEETATREAEPEESDTPPRKRTGPPRGGGEPSEAAEPSQRAEPESEASQPPPEDAPPSGDRQEQEGDTGGDAHVPGERERPAGRGEPEPGEAPAGGEEAAPDAGGVAPGARERASRLFRQAGKLAEAGDLEGAIDRYGRAVAANAELVDAYNNLGVLLTRTGRPDSAARVLEAALSRERDDQGLLTNVGLAYLEQGRPREALDAFREALASGDAPIETHVNLGIAYRRLNRPGDAERALRAALRRAPGHPVAHYNLALALDSQDRPSEALRHYSAFLESDAGDPALRARVQAYVDALRRGGPR